MEKLKLKIGFVKDDEGNIIGSTSGYRIHIDEFERYPAFLKAIYENNGININQVRDDGYIYYDTITLDDCETYKISLDFVMRTKGFDLNFAGYSGKLFFNKLKNKLKSKFAEIETQQYLWESFNYKCELKHLEERISRGDAIMFWEHSDYMFEIKSFKIQPYMSHNYLTNFTSIGYFKTETYYNDDYVDCEAFITDRDMNWVFFLNHEGYTILEDL